MLHISDLNYEDLKQYIKKEIELDEKKTSMRVNQIWKFYYQKGFSDYNLFSNLPEELRIGAVLRDTKVIIPRSNFTFKKDDRVVFIAKKDSISIVENIFRLSSV